VERATDKPLDPALVAQRAAAADSIERRLKWLLPLASFYGPALVALGISDLAFGWVGASHRLDVVFILLGATAFYPPLRLRSTVRRLRTVKTERTVTKPQVALAFVPTIGMAAFAFVVGYLLFGWVVGALFTGALILLLAAFMLQAWIRVRRRRQAAEI
jgi:1,4-dihydroxy-2-naphthoate octaprenyltransferase